MSFHNIDSAIIGREDVCGLLTNPLPPLSVRVGEFVLQEGGEERG
jgi:hypothetical protein